MSNRRNVHLSRVLDLRQRQSQFCSIHYIGARCIQNKIVCAFPSFGNANPTVSPNFFLFVSKANAELLLYWFTHIYIKQSAASIDE